MKKELYMVTSNRRKLGEMRRLLGAGLGHADIEIPEKQAIQVREVIEGKARAAYLRLKKPVLVEDTGVYLKCLNGFPGALVKWLLESVGNEGICRLAGSYRDKSAYVETAIAFYDGKELRTFVGRVRGRIADRPRGRTGFGWDRVFMPEGLSITYSEMTGREKDSISMRRLAAAKLARYLRKRGFLS